MSQKEQFLAQYGDTEHIDELLKSNPTWRTKRTIARNPTASAENITTLLNDPLDAKEVSREAIGHPNVTVDHITSAMKSKDHVTRMRAVRHPLATREHIEKGLSDFDYHVRYASLDSKHINNDDIEKAMMDSTATVRSAATGHPLITPEQKQRYNDKLNSGAFGHPV